MVDSAFSGSLNLNVTSKSFQTSGSGQTVERCYAGALGTDNGAGKLGVATVT